MFLVDHFSLKNNKLEQDVIYVKLPLVIKLDLTGCSQFSLCLPQRVLFIYLLPQANRFQKIYAVVMNILQVT